VEQDRKETPCGGLQLCDVQMWFAPGFSDPDKYRWDSRLFVGVLCSICAPIRKVCPNLVSNECLRAYVIEIASLGIGLVELFQINWLSCLYAYLDEGMCLCLRSTYIDKILTTRNKYPNRINLE